MYTPPNFVPSSEPCIMPTVIEMKGRVSAGGTLWRSKDCGKLNYVQIEWIVFDSTTGQYRTTANENEITITGTTTKPPVPVNPPKVRVTFFSPEGVAVGTYTAPQYILKWTEITPPVPPATAPTSTPKEEITSGLPNLRTQLNYSAQVHAPTADEVADYTFADDPSMLSVAAKVKMTFYDSSIDNKYIIASAPTDPSAIRTGPTYTLAFLSKTEKNNNTGTMSKGQGKVKYNYSTSAWDPHE